MPEKLGNCTTLATIFTEKWTNPFILIASSVKWEINHNHTSLLQDSEATYTQHFSQRAPRVLYKQRLWRTLALSEIKANCLSMIGLHLQLLNKPQVSLQALKLNHCPIKSRGFTHMRAHTIGNRCYRKSGWPGFEKFCAYFWVLFQKMKSSWVVQIHTNINVCWPGQPSV